MTLTLIIDCLIDALADCGRMVPFLFIAFLILESIEHYSDSFLSRVLTHQKLGPLPGAVLGLVPQCGFSALASSLYCGGAVTIGTLLAVYLSTSDEAILIMLANPQRMGDIWLLLVTKLCIAIPAGFLIDYIWKKIPHHEKHAEDLCEDCGCHDHKGILVPALRHTVKLFVFLLVFTFALNLVIELIGFDRLSGLFLQGSFLQPLLTALVGMIPNCAASILVTELYLSGVISFGSAAAGLCTGAGAGLLILFRTNHDLQENLRITALLYGIAAAAGLILQLIF